MRVSKALVNEHAATSDYDSSSYKVVDQVRSVSREVTAMGSERFFLGGYNLEVGTLKEDECVGINGPFCWVLRRGRS